MFANRMMYTKSPGGIRRGLIWQSGTEITPGPVDNRYHIFTPWGVTYTETNWLNPYRPYSRDIELPNGFPISESGQQTIYGTATGFRVPTSNPIPLHCPLYTYIPTTDIDPNGNYFLSSFADELSYYEDVDFYLDPLETEVTDIDDNYDEPIITLNNKNYRIINSSHELRNAPKPFNKGYYMSSAGDCDTQLPGSSNQSYDFLKNVRWSYPSCPMRIQMRVVYSDYPFTLSGAFTGGYQQARAIEFPFDACTSYFNNILDQYNYPSDSQFAGSKIKSKNDGQYYDNFEFPSFQVTPGIRKSIYNSSITDEKFYRYTEGALYDGLDYGAQMYLTPLLYPAVIGASRGNYNDYTLYLPSVASDVTTLYMGQHAHPYMIPPTIKMPAITRVSYSNQGNTVTPRYGTGGARLRFNSGTWHQNEYDVPFMVTSDAHYFSADKSLLGAKGIKMNTLSTPTPSYLHFNNITGATGSFDIVQGFVQPVIRKGEKYTQEFRVICSKGDTKASSNKGEFMGRYKYLAFKGKISFFETNN